MATEGSESVFLVKAIVYLAGVECPVHEVGVVYGEGTIPQLSITVPSVPEFDRFGAEDKVPVAVFYLDQWYTDTGDEKDLVMTPRLLFDGDITGFDFQKTVYGDSTVLTATGNISTLGQMFATYVSGGGAAGMNNLIQGGGSTQQVTSFQSELFPFVLFKKGLFAHGSDVSRPFDFIDNLLLQVKIGGNPKTSGPTVAINPNGTYSQKLLEAAAVANGLDRIDLGFYDQFVDATATPSAAMDFFVRYNHKTKFDQRWVATPIEEFLENGEQTTREFVRDPTFRAIMDHVLTKTMMGTMENLFGSTDSYLRILQVFYSFVVYDILMLPTAPLVTVGSRGQLDSGIPTETFQASAGADIRLANYVSKPGNVFALPPECNIIFPQMVQNASYGENYAAQVTRTIAGSPFLDHYGMRVANTAEDNLIRTLASSNGWPEALSELTRKFTTVNSHNLLLFPEEYFKGPVVNNITMPAWYMMIEQAAQSYQSRNTKTLAENNKQQALGTDKPHFEVQEGQGTPSASQLEESKTKFKDTFDIFTRYTRLKYHESRFAARQGSIAPMAFNPYIIPGYNCVFFNPRGAGFHFFGHVTKVSHSISARGGMTTSVQYAYGRTAIENYEGALQEAFDAAVAGVATPFRSMYPPHPTKTLADTLQVNDAAADYYHRVFYQDAQNKKYVFNYTDYFKTTSHSLLPGVAVPSATQIPGNIKNGYEVTLELKDEALTDTDSYDKAMRRISRPICSLEEYVSFINGGRNVTVAYENLVPADVYGVAVPVVIRPYLASQDAENNILEHHIEPTTKPPVTPLDTRRDWAGRVKRYRQRVYNREVM